MLSRLAAAAALALLFVLPAPAHAGTSVKVGELSVDGVTVLDMHCDLSKGGGFLAGAAVVGALAKQKAAFDKCGPDGQAARVGFAWAGKKTKDVRVIGATAPKTGACVAKVLKKLKSGLGGACQLTVLTGPADAAKKAAAALAPKKANPFADPKAWKALTHKKQGWTMHILDGGKAKDAALKLGEATWNGAAVTHDKQLSWVLWHPKAKLDAKTFDAISEQAVKTSKKAKWSKVNSTAGGSGFKTIKVQQTIAGKHRLVRVAATAPGGSYFFMALFSKNMPDSVIKTWLTGLKTVK